MIISKDHKNWKLQINDRQMGILHKLLLPYRDTLVTSDEELIWVEDLLVMTDLELKFKQEEFEDND